MKLITTIMLKEIFSSCLTALFAILGSYYYIIYPEYISPLPYDNPPLLSIFLFAIVMFVMFMVRKISHNEYREEMAKYCIANKEKALKQQFFSDVEVKFTNEDKKLYTEWY